MNRLISGVCLFLSFFSMPMVAEPNPYPEHISKVQSITAQKLAGLMGTIDRDNPQVKNAQAFLNRIRETTFYFDDICSANFISNSGHAIMAHHCLSRFLKLSIGKNKNYLSISPDLIGEEVQLNFQNQSQFHLPFSFATKIKIVAVGKGYPNPDKMGSIQSDPSMSYLNEDYAIVKFHKLPKTHRCTKTSSNLPNTEDIVWVTGFPKYIERTTQTLFWLYKKPLTFRTQSIKNTEDRSKLNYYLESAHQLLKEMLRQRVETDPYLYQESFRASHELHISVGRFFHSASEVSKKFNWPFPKESASYDTIYQYPKYFVSTASAARGMSGGGVFNTQGELIGVNSSLMGGPSIYSNFKLGIRHISIKYVREQIRKLDDQIENEYFDCKD